MLKIIVLISLIGHARPLLSEPPPPPVSPVIDWEGKNYRVIKKYLKVQRRYSKKLCRGSWQTYERLMKKYRGHGFYVPHLSYTSLDRDAIKKNLEFIEQKIEWLTLEIEKLERKKNFEIEKKKYKKLKQLFEDVLDIKQKFHESKSKNRENILREGEKRIESLRDKMESLLDSLSFLKPFGYPVDHFRMRKEYDHYKDLEDIKGQKKKNEIFFKRKIFEDGAQNPNFTKPDRFFRALINTIGIEFPKQKSIIDENFRYDFNSFLKKLETHLEYTKRHHLERIKEWKDRTQRTLNFYLDLLQESRKQYTKAMLERMSKHRYDLSAFNFKKQRQVYDFWLRQSELNRALFVLETILFNEVGEVDGRDGLERRDVTQVVINRTRIPFYRTIEEKEKIYPYLESLGKRKLNNSKWLNVMFKQGEFSFTYFFIPSSQNIYCPDMSRKGQFLRKENLKIALEMLKRPSDEFRAIRYFSRASMFGRVNMANIWLDHKPLPPRIGNKSKKKFSLKRAYRRGKYRLLYQFHDGENRPYHVLDINDKICVYDPKARHFFDYRNPHFFQYFAIR
ncbi:MAG: hypothetical protein OXB88_01105 [Bacteriovoracales bacterium]|nr:hypothetical protein [Bacteriovoracales bacterium]